MPLISVQKIEKSYGNRIVLDQISLTVNEGDRIALIGSNGAGKTTLFRIIEGSEIPEEGKVIRHAGTRVGFLSQNLEDIPLSESPIKNPELTKLERQMKDLSEFLASFIVNYSIYNI